MTEDRAVFEEAMQAAANAAWDQDWNRAIEAYQRALTEFPQDAGALAGLGFVLAGAGQHEAALRAYQRADELVPDDPGLLERMGQVQEQLGQGQAAAEAYLASAELYLGQQAVQSAVERWQDAVRAWPDCLQAYVHLLRYYQQSGQLQEAVEQCLALAGIYRRQGDFGRAIQVCEHALKLAPHDSKIMSTIEALRAGASGGEQAAPTGEGASSPADLGLEDTDVEALEGQGSPIAMTRQRALTDLAESFFEEEVPTRSSAPLRMSKAEIDGLIGKAIDLQTRGQVDEALNAYQTVVKAGVVQPAIHFNLGLLHQEKLHFDAAISEFNQAIANPEYKLGSLFALGECHRANGHLDEALKCFVEVLKIVDLATVQDDQAGDLIQFYDLLAERHAATGDPDQATEFTNALVAFLSEQGWEDKVMQARRRLNLLAEEGATLSLAEMLEIPGAERILESIALSQECTKRGMYYTALEECYSTLGKAPTYLPTHRQLAHILLEMGKAEDAVSKFVAVASTYLVRGNFWRAAAMYKRALSLSPMDTSVRTRLIDMLVNHGEIDDALENYMALADSYRNLAQMDQAREIYQEALRTAPRGDPGRQWPVRLLHKIGDIDMQRVDWKRAVDIFERIRKLAPGDERARLQLMELRYRLGRQDLAISELDGLLKIYRDSNNTERIFAVLEDAVNERPDDIPLRARLAQEHLNAGNVDQALKHLDTLGDLQLNAGRSEEARATIRAIIALNPPNVVSYQQLLEQIS